MDEQKFTPLTTDEILERAYHVEAKSQQIFEVGINKTYNSISEAIFVAVDGDEIRIYSGFYNETFDCLKDLTFTGVPDDVKNFSTYPQIYNGDENQVNSIIGKCSFSNIIFVEQKAAELKDYEKILGGEILSDELIKKYRREEEENSHLEVFCLVVENESHIEDSYFWNEAPGRFNDEEILVSVILANEATSIFQNCDFSAKQTKNVKLTMSADRTKVVYRNCNFHDAEDGIGIFDDSDCSVDECKFENISELEIRMSGEKDSKLKVCDTVLNERTMGQFKKHI